MSEATLSGQWSSAAPLVRISAALGRGDRVALAAALDAAASEPPIDVEEVLLQSYLFLGYPAALNAFALWRERFPDPASGPVADDWTSWRARGERVCGRVYGGQYRRLRRNIQRLHPDMERWMLAEGYGKVLGRPGPPLAVRELCIVALLAGQDAAAQLYAHMRGALNAGAAEDEVAAALEVACEELPAERVSAAWDVWRKVRSRRLGDAAFGAD